MTDTQTWPLTAAVLWGALCYLGGVATGVKITHRKLTREVTMEVREVRAWLRGKGPSLLMAIALVSVGTQWYVSNQNHRGDVRALQVQASSIRAQAAAIQQQNDCLTRYANRNYEALNPRQIAAERLQRADNRQNDALVKLLNDVLIAHPNPNVGRADAERFRTAARAKQQIAHHLSLERARKPYPQPPKKVCPK